ncbi:MAG: amino acid ABC transporter permease [Clostridia bacterium]|nr:amino acid ABC transporter permease [Clostridia bacterium]
MAEFLKTLISILTQLGSGFLTSIILFFLTLIFSIPLGLLVAKGRMSKNIVISSLVRFYISVMRGTPLMLQLLLVYFGPYYLFNINLRSLKLGPIDYRNIAAVIGFSINYAAYFGEIFRSGIQSMSKGQYEAATVLGFSKTQTYFRIILPQVIKRVLPAVTNEVITLVKDTSLAQAISVIEMFTVAKQISAAQASVIPLFAAGIFYYVFNGLVEIVMNRFEKKMSYYQ